MPRIRYLRESKRQEIANADGSGVSERHCIPAGLPEPDLLIRTSGEMRVSNFLLWQIAYAEIYVTETLWPDFNRARLLEAFVEFQKRDRRYGGIGQDKSTQAECVRWRMTSSVLE